MSVLNSCFCCSEIWRELPSSAKQQSSLAYNERYRSKAVSYPHAIPNLYLAYYNFYVTLPESRNANARIRVLLRYARAHCDPRYHRWLVPAEY